MEKIEISKESFSSSAVCGQCHEAIYKDWKDSMHASAITDPIFHAVFLEAQHEGGETTAKLCLSCHSPTTRVTHDFSLKQDISKEGIICDFCHSVKNVTLGKSNAFEMDISGTKYGPFKDVESSVHDSAYSKLHEQSEFCAGCHEFKNENGVSVLSTYSEWKAGPYAAEGVTCQKCHMPARKGLVVSGKVKPVEKYINSHKARGGHSIKQLQKSISVNIGKVSQHDQRVNVAVEVTNIGSGHKLPTGIPSRKLVLTFRVKDQAGVVYEEKREYQKLLAYENKEPIERDDHYFTKAALILKDNRIAPRETREEHFSFLVPYKKEYILSATIDYLYEPLILQKTQMRLQLIHGEETLEVK